MKDMKAVRLVESKPKSWVEEVEEVVKTWKIILFNDNDNSFDDVILLLILYCQHDEYQAEQCALIAHTKGKYAIKEGPREEMENIASALAENGLTVELV